MNSQRPVYDVNPHSDPDRSPDRQGFISPVSFNSEARMQASSFVAQPQYQPSQQHWRSPESTYPQTGHGQVTRRHSHERYEHAAELSFSIPPRTYDQGSHTYNPHQAGPLPQPSYYGPDVAPRKCSSDIV